MPTTAAPAPEKPAMPEGKRLDGHTNFERGARDYSVKQDGGKIGAAKLYGGGSDDHPCYDFDAPEKVYTNGHKAANKTRVIQGQLNGEEIKIPDVNSGYNHPHPDVVLWKPEYKGLPDALSHRMKFGVIIPSTNTTVEYDFWTMIKSNPALEGIGFHVAGILIDAPKLATDADMLEFLEQFRRQIFVTCDRVMTAEPEYLIMGMSLETFFGGWEGNKEFKAELSGRCGLSLSTGAEACKAALGKFGAKRVGIITPYQDIGDRNVVKFFEEIGCEVKKIVGLKCGSATDIAHVPEAWCEEVIRTQLNLPDVDAIVQCGTNLSMVRLAERLEPEIGKPIIAINAATLWFGLRQCGISEPMYGCGRLCREF
eukprot:TRINITY_DN69937_c0_g1_i1.p1 TRINITY_DN69937_c0_g1~~TRINITY_DN69937_c0_g1_i1.p1  ORF type:complete len:390 (+),score=164.64 TRINITY_DN69937_c0_g1_i1:69-1172(+)